MSETTLPQHTDRVGANMPCCAVLCRSSRPPTPRTFLGQVRPLTVIIVGLLPSLENRTLGIHSGGWVPSGYARVAGVWAAGYHSLLLSWNTLSWMTNGSSRMSVGSIAPPGGGYGKPGSSGPGGQHQEVGVRGVGIGVAAT